jgi:hypothetical protein
VVGPGGEAEAALASYAGAQLFASQAQVIPVVTDLPC